MTLLSVLERNCPNPNLPHILLGPELEDKRNVPHSAALGRSQRLLPSCQGPARLPRAEPRCPEVAGASCPQVAKPSCPEVAGASCPQVAEPSCPEEGGLSCPQVAELPSGGHAGLSSSSRAQPPRDGRPRLPTGGGAELPRSGRVAQRRPGRTAHRWQSCPEAAEPRCPAAAGVPGQRAQRSAPGSAAGLHRALYGEALT